MVDVFCLAFFNSGVECFWTGMASAPYEPDAEDEESEGHDGSAMATNEAGLPTPFEIAAEFVVSWLEHAWTLRGSWRGSIGNASRICCWLSIERLRRMGEVCFATRS